MIYILCGVPASGKTTKGTQLSKKNGAKLYSYDVVRRESKLKSFDDICKVIYQKIHNDLMNGLNVVYDAPHTKLKHRKDILEAISDISCKKVLIVMNTPIEECIRRNACRDNSVCLPEPIIYDFYNTFEYPTLDEGWDEIIYI